MVLIAKIGTSSITDEHGRIRSELVDRFCDDVASVRKRGRRVVIVTSGAIAAGLPALGLAKDRPKDPRTLQAASAVGQTRLMVVYEQALARHDLLAGQILLAPSDFFERTQYLHARGTLERLLDLGVIPVINENDAVADDAIRFGDNDRIAALVAHLVGAERLVLLTDTRGLFSSDPKTDESATLIEEIESVTADLPAITGGPGTARGSGGMASKVAAARMAAFSGVTTVIAAADRPNVLQAALDEEEGVGTIVRPQPRPLPARKLWIGFAIEPVGEVVVDVGARRAVEGRGGSLLAVGISSCSGAFTRGDCVELTDQDGVAFARGLAAVSSTELQDILGVRSSEHPAGTPREVIHRDELVLLS